jgi:hypothetical protein
MKRRDVLAALGAAGWACAAVEGETEAQADHPAQDMGPAGRFHLYLCAFHIAKKDPSFVVEAHHYCSPVADDVHQCVIFDSTGKNARILGVEYIISDALYRKLPPEERKYYHPHSYEILSGLLVAPGMPAKEEDGLLSGLITSWGKTWHTWPDPSTALPMGEPLLMWSATRDGQIPATELAARDKRLGISTPEIRKRRAALGEVPQTAPPRSLDDLGRQFTDDGPDVPRTKR